MTKPFKIVELFVREIQLHSVMRSKKKKPPDSHVEAEYLVLG